MKHRLPRLLVVLVVLGAVTFAVVRSRRAAAGGDPNLVTGSGTVEAVAIGVAAEAGGRITHLLVDEGDTVAEGQILAELDRATLEAELERAEAVAYTARMYLAEVTRGARPEELRAREARLDEALAAMRGSARQAAIAGEAERRPHELLAAEDRAASEAAATAAAVRQARAALDEAQAGPRPEELEQARAALRAAQARISSAEAERARAAAARRGAEAELAQTEAADRERQAATTQTAAAETQLEVARAALAAAQARRDLVGAEPRPDQRDRLRQEVAAAEAAFTLTRQERSRAETLYAQGAVAERQLDSARAAHDSAAARLEAARAALADLEAGAREPERREAGAAVEQAAAAVAGADQALANAQREERILRSTTRQQLERARAAVDQAREAESAALAAIDTARQQADSAQATVDLLDAGTRRERIRQAEAALAAAEAGRSGAAEATGHAGRAARDRFSQRQAVAAAQQQLDQAAARADAASAELDLALAGATSEMKEVARGDLEQAQAAVRRIAAQIAQTVVRAPRDGVISEVVLREGETVTPGSVVVRMFDLSDLWVRVYLPLTQFTRVRRGQPARLAADAAPDSPFRGEVSTVSDEAEFTPRNTQTVDERIKQVFWVKVTVLEGGGVLKPGVPVDVAIEAPALP